MVTIQWQTLNFPQRLFFSTLFLFVVIHLLGPSGETANSTLEMTTDPTEHFGSPFGPVSGGVAINGGSPKMDGSEWKIPEKMDDLGVPAFLETSINGH